MLRALLAARPTPELLRGSAWEPALARRAQPASRSSSAWFRGVRHLGHSFLRYLSSHRWPHVSHVIHVREMVIGDTIDKIYMVMDFCEHDVKQLLALPPTIASRLFFGFSHTVNVAMGGGGDPTSKAHIALLEAIRAVPEQRLLVESDVDDAADAPEYTAGTNTNIRSIHELNRATFAGGAAEGAAW